MEYTVAYRKTVYGGIRAYSSPLLDSYGVINAFPERHGGVSEGFYGSLNLSTSTGDTEENVRENTRRYLAAFGAVSETAVKSHQVHSDHILRVTSLDGGKGLLAPNVACDGLLTDEPDLTLLASSADCPLILLYSPDRRMIAAVHAGWRGTSLDIAGKAVNMFIKNGADVKSLVAFLPPSIGPCCFETDPDVPEAMNNRFKGELDDYICEISPARYRVNLQGINAHALARRGMDPRRIEVAPICTCCHEDFYSHRRSKTQRGLSAALIRMSK